jgi:hypothetical protein
MAPPDGLKLNMSTAIPQTARAVNLSTIVCENDSAGHIFTGRILAMGIHRPISPTLSLTRQYGGLFNDPGTIVTPILSGLHDRYART